MDTPAPKQRSPVTLNTALLFDCADEALRVGIWTQPDPDPEKDVAALELAGKHAKPVADEAELSRFLASLKPLRPLSSRCHDHRPSTSCAGMCARCRRS